MEFSSYLLLLLVALSVSAVQEGLKEPHEVLSPDAEDKILGGCLPQGKNPSLEFPLTFGCSGKERHSLYHNYSNHSNNWIVKATVQFDGVEVYCFIHKTTGTWTSSPWGIRMMDVDYTFRNYSKKLYHHLKETDIDFTQRYGCEAERSSSGAVTLLNSTAEFRLNGKIVLHFNAHRDQWEALDERFQAVKTEWDSLTHFNQIIKHYLLQGCTDRLRCYLQYYDKHIRHRTSGVGPRDKPLPYTECPDEDIRNSTSGVGPSDKPLLSTECPDEHIAYSTEGKYGIGVVSVLLCIPIACVAAAMAFARLMKKMMRKNCEKVVEDIKHTCRRHSDVMNDHQDGGDAVQTQRRSTASMNEPPDMRGSTASMLQPPDMRGSTASMLQPPDMRGSTASMLQPPDMRGSTASMPQPPDMRRSTASMPQPPDMRRSTASMPQPPDMRSLSSSLDFLPPVMRSLSSSMGLPPVNMSNADDDDDGQTCSKNSRTRTAGLTRAVGRLRSTTISFPTFDL
ncbi:hypothetical protein SRHO_G00101320 [Serrasalmus rhombeus]